MIKLSDLASGVSDRCFLFLPVTAKAVSLSAPGAVIGWVDGTRTGYDAHGPHMQDLKG